MSVSGKSRRHGFAILATLALAGSGAAAASWTETPFNPKPGSSWTILSDLDRTETRVENGSRSVIALKKTIKSVLVFNAKTADGGYRITFTRRETKASGDPGEVALARIEGEIMNNLVIRAVTDRNGKPLRVENLEEIRNKRQQLVDRLTATADAQTAAIVRRMLDGLTKVDEVGATSHLSVMELLAMAQNAGLKPGETRRSTTATPNGIGPALVKARELSILQTDAANGNALVLLTESYTEESMREFLAVIARRSVTAGQDPNERERDMRRMKMSLNNRFEIGVAGGMSRTLSEESVTASDLLGNTMVIKDQRKVTVSPMP